jgi:hypothetical protein
MIRADSRLRFNGLRSNIVQHSSLERINLAASRNVIGVADLGEIVRYVWCSPSKKMGAAMVDTMLRATAATTTGVEKWTITNDDVLRIVNRMY